MKKTAFLILVILASASCKKKYACHCSTTVSYNSFTQYIFISKTTSISEKMTKKQAQSVCDDETANLNATYANISSNNGTRNNTGGNQMTSSASCNLE